MKRDAWRGPIRSTESSFSSTLNKASTYMKSDLWKRHIYSTKSSSTSTLGKYAYNIYLHTKFSRIGLLCVYIGLFCVNIQLVCAKSARYHERLISQYEPQLREHSRRIHATNLPTHGYLWLFCGYIGPLCVCIRLFCGNSVQYWWLFVCVCVWCECVTGAVWW